ncbi:hypothetical protein M595_4232 [Lyngbya aestuarii BL J]|uniref:Uncharacterized protein n=1 Tax=Lyngbya aestuarii BL J TaxID=1348334 RepID=U7QDA4_9CYAN|nr:hypothetical protein M595_4232 [Lyngbya aestuarii BL J]
MSFDRLTLTSENGDTIIQFGNERLAILQGIPVNQVRVEDFISL